MPRTYKPRAKQYKKYDKEAINVALREYEISNCSLVYISKKHNISKSVLHRHNTRFMKKQGGQMVLTADQEAYIIENINYCSEWGYPLDTYDLRILVKGYLDKLGVNVKKFKENLPGPDYVKSFLKRNQDKISLRISQNIKRSRVAVSREVVEENYTHLKKSIAGVPVSNIINHDEANLSDDPGTKSNCSIETELEESARESDQELSTYISESDLEETQEPSQNTIDELSVTSSNRKNEDRVRIQSKIAKVVPEEKKRKFEAKYTMKKKNTFNIVTSKAAQEKDLELEVEKTEIKKRKLVPQNSTINKQSIKNKKNKRQLKTTELSKNINQYENTNIDVLKQPHDVKKYTEMKKQEKRTKIENAEKELDIEKMPLFFEDDFCLQEEIETSDTYLSIESKTEQENVEKVTIHTNEKKEAAKSSNMNTNDKITITTDENFESKEKIQIGLKNMTTLALTLIKLIGKLQQELKSIT